MARHHKPRKHPKKEADRTRLVGEADRRAMGDPSARKQPSKTRKVRGNPRASVIDEAIKKQKKEEVTA